MNHPILPICNHYATGNAIVDSVLVKGIFHTRLIDYRLPSKGEYFWDHTEPINTEIYPNYIAKAIKRSVKYSKLIYQYLSRNDFTNTQHAILDHIISKNQNLSIKSLISDFNEVSPDLLYTIVEGFKSKGLINFHNNRYICYKNSFAHLVEHFDESANTHLIDS
ncbi:MAG: hypothetical protein RIC35_11995 [Marinoscillum sp.]